MGLCLLFFSLYNEIYSTRSSRLNTYNLCSLNMNNKLLFILMFMLLMVQAGQSNAGFAQEVVFETSLLTPDDGIVIETRYGFSEDFGKWKITDNKAIEIQMNVLESNAEVILVEHLHADVFVESTSSAFDGVLQDSMDDKFHGDQGGFLINTNYSYYETFSIEGTNDQFTQTMFDMYCYNTGYGGGCDGDSISFRISERTLTGEYGVYGNSIIFVFDLNIKYEGEDFYHKQIITDNILIDLEEGIGDNSGDRADKEVTKETMGSSTLWYFMIGVIVIVAFFRNRSIRFRII